MFASHLFSSCILGYPQVDCLAIQVLGVGFQFDLACLCFLLALQGCAGQIVASGFS
jgi:hypothetical protein